LEQTELAKAHLKKLNDMQNNKLNKIKPVNLKEKMSNPLYGCKILPHNTHEFLYKCKRSSSSGNIQGSLGNSNNTQEIEQKKIERIQSAHRTVSDTLSQNEELFPSLKKANNNNVQASLRKIASLKNIPLNLIDYNVENVANFGTNNDYG